MPRICLRLLTYCTVIGLSFALEGKGVRTVLTGEYTYVVSIAKTVNARNPGGKTGHYCTGTVLNRRNILTASHCLLNKTVDDIEVSAGSIYWTDGEKYYPKSLTTYQEWKHGRREERPSLDDIGVITLQGAGITNPNVTRAVVLFLKTEQIGMKKVSIAGWGRNSKGTMSTNMRRASLTVISNEKCSEKGTELKGRSFVVPPNYFCSMANPWVLSTFGDGGAPIVNRKRELVGLNIGVSPVIEGPISDKSVLKHKLLNTHLNFYKYADFIRHFQREVLFILPLSD